MIKKTNKWLILLGFSAILGVNQLLWLSFATIVISTQTHFGVSEFLANLLTLIFPIIFVLLAIHSGKLLDKLGYKKVVSAAALLMLAGSIFRWLGASQFAMVFFGQLCIAISQPYITNAINQITGDWFAKEQLATATGLITGGMFLATAVGAFIPAPLIAAHGFSGMLFVNVLITAAAVMLFLFTINEKPKAHHDALSLETIGSLLHNKHLWLISVAVFIAIGYFNGLSNWIAPLLAPRGFDEEAAGLITAVLILGGIFGAIVIPILSDKLQKRRVFLLLATAVGLLATYPLLYVASSSAALIIGFLLGFFLLAGYPILIATAEDVVHPSQTAQAVAMLMLMGNLGGVVVVSSMQGVKTITESWPQAGYVLLALMVMLMFVVINLKDKTDLQAK